jgi:ClpX C4-type zinc finger
LLLDYKDLFLTGAFVREILLNPGKVLTLKILRGPVRKNDRDVVEELLLEFRNLHAFQAEVNSDLTEPSIEILSHSLNPSATDMPAIDFVLSCDKGHFTITAADFSWSVIDEIPFVSSPAYFDGARNAAKQREPELVICSFCGRSANEVLRIIKGNLGSICSDCVQTCVTIIG